MHGLLYSDNAIFICLQVNGMTHSQTASPLQVLYLRVSTQYINNRHAVSLPIVRLSLSLLSDSSMSTIILSLVLVVLFIALVALTIGFAVFFIKLVY